MLPDWYFQIFRNRKRYRPCYKLHFFSNYRYLHYNSNTSIQLYLQSVCSYMKYPQIYFSNFIYEETDRKTSIQNFMIPRICVYLYTFQWSPTRIFRHITNVVTNPLQSHQILNVATKRTNFICYSEPIECKVKTINVLILSTFSFTFMFIQCLLIVHAILCFIFKYSHTSLATIVNKHFQPKIYEIAKWI